MAGPETIHRVVEKIEVQGGRKAEDAFNQLGGAADRAAKALGHTKSQGEQLASGFGGVEKSADQLGGSAEEAGKKFNLMGFMGETGLGKMVAGFTAGQVAASLIMKAIDFVIVKIRAFVDRAWELNKSFQAMQSRVQGITLALVDWNAMGVKGADQIGQAFQIANKELEIFDKIAVRTAMRPEVIEDAFTRVNAVLSSMGMNQAGILEQTEDIAAAAKVFGEDVAMAGSIAAKAMQEGVIEGETALARALKAQVGPLSKISQEERVKRVSEFLKRMGAGIKDVTQDTQSMITRWQVLADRILQRMVQPAYQKIGQIVGQIVDWTQRNEAAINAVVIEVQEWFHAIWDVGKGLWDITTALGKVLADVQSLGDQFAFAWEYTKLFRQGVSFIGTGLQLLVQWVKVLAGDDEGFGKLMTLSAAIGVKWLEIKKQIVETVKAFANLSTPDLVKKIPGVQGFFDTMDKVAKDIDVDIQKTGERLRRMEKAHLGGEAITETTRAMQQEMAKATKEALTKAKGLKVTQNIAKVEIHQDFRDQDPDRVLVEFVTDLERLGETALQSTVGGEATVFGPGGF